jgi:predicted RNase H-like HicB family nuclease
MPDEYLRYPITIFWSDEDAAFIAIAPDLPGCSAFGVSRGRAAVAISQAINCWIDAARKAGNPVPAPSAGPRPAGG